MFHVPENNRLWNHPILSSRKEDGNNGFFVMPHPKIVDHLIQCQVSDGSGWEHVSVSICKKGQKQTRCPNWEEMCYVKSVFWDEEDWVCQFHPAKSEYVNMHPYVLHLWRPTDQALPMPDKTMVGVNLK